MGRGRAPVRAEGVAEVVLQAAHHLGDAFGDLGRLAVGFGQIVAVFRAGFEIFAQFLIALKIVLAGIDELLCVLRTVAQELIDGEEGISNDGKPMNQAAAAVVLRALLLSVARIDAGFQTAHEAAQEGHRKQRQRTACTVGGVAHGVADLLKPFVEQLAQVREDIFGGVVRLGAHGQTRERRAAVCEHQLQNLAHVQPAIGRVGVVLAHDERLLAARDGVVGQILRCDAVLPQGEEQTVVVEQRGRQAAGREEEASHFAVKLLGCVAVQLHGENGLREIHVVIRVQNGIAHLVRQVVAVQIASADQHVLRDRPRALTHVEEYKEMLEQRCGLRAILTGELAVRFKNAVGVADGEGERVRRLF